MFREGSGKVQGRFRVPQGFCKFLKVLEGP